MSEPHPQPPIYLSQVRWQSAVAACDELTRAACALHDELQQELRAIGVPAASRRELREKFGKAMAQVILPLLPAPAKRQEPPLP